MVWLQATAKGARLLHAGRTRRVAALEAELATLAPAERETIAAATALLERLRHGSGSTAGHDEAGATGRTGKTGGGRRKAR